ncbi:MAG: hypothetical protein CMG66_03830 [Candidatus Marinimicrobia bacterium]|nr:hypothetical protein [Candidatus Neomarinimicrobiota bacterium]|tara:strand:- start:47318 stop:47584 length:267 start_codon:yes stop_codon:yes gene_type:complete
MMKNAEKTTLTEFAKKIVDKRVSVLAIFLLESTKHISFIAGQTLIFFGPILTLFVKDKKYYDFINLLEERKNIEFLISEIECLHFKTK